jgi:hypothetical protein
LPVCSTATLFGVTASTLSGAPQPIFPKLDRSLVAAFPSPATIPAFADSIPGSVVLACCFAVSLAGFHARSVFRLCCRNWFAPIPAASTLQTRCIFASKLIRPLSPSPLPSRNFGSLGIKAFNGRCCRPVRLPKPPDFRSLPAAGSIARLRLRIIVRDSLRLRRLAVPQTSWNLTHYALLTLFTSMDF